MMYAHPDQLRPTQMTIGSRYVNAKALLTERHRWNVDAFMARHAVHVALGPHNAMYVVDHHHWACAWQRAGFDRLPVHVVADFSGCSEDAFWEQMQDRHWLHPFDEHGVRSSLAELPLVLHEMADDPYHSLSAFARRAGAYRKPNHAYESFVWADFFRARVPIHDSSEAAFALALVHAIRVARTRDAASMPGFIGKR
ncbi:ParB/Srx family N-terminal domain-containing protein [Paraburkholderia diazotrophica]|uniref:ParB-like nuclease n=1 Tax=Paraburkholderia diazotrophica TaxID=667676 RepID=A0A1H6WB75_9BURK|nr:ParB/Srx family N-terminal domain-containing protein [Paraburkholderia diazotrophica]SEJ14279.1 hypothetical protein SAMN05192539_100744 [Paraburkholderia diazotrophica]